MPLNDEDVFGKGKDGTTLKRLRLERERNSVVLSKDYSYNPTSLAVETSLKEIFDEFGPLVAGELRTLTTPEENDEPFF